MSWNRPEAVLREVAERFGADRLALAASWQKESSVLVDLVQRIAPGARIFTLDTGVLFEETYATWRADRGALRHRDRGLPRASGSTGLWATDPDRCCVLRKVEPLERALAGADALDHRPAPRAVAAARRHAEARVGRRAATSGRQPARRLDRQGRLARTSPSTTCRTTRCTTRATPRSAARHCTAAGRRPRGPLGRAGEDRVRAARRTDRHRHRSDALAPRALEAEAIHVIREVAAELERPVLLFSGGKDSIVLLRLAEKAFRPAPLPVPGHARRHGPQLPRGDRVPRPRASPSSASELIVASVQESIDNGRVAEETGPRASRNRLQTVTLLDAIAEHGFDAAFGGARRDEERARAKERMFSLPRRLRPVGPAPPAAGAVGPLQRPRPPRRARARVPALQLDRARRLGVHRRRGASSCRRSTSRTSARCSSATGCSTPSRDYVELHRRRGAVHRVGALPHGRRHDAAPARCARRATTLEDVVAEIAATRITERGETRADDRVVRGRDGRPQARGLLLGMPTCCASPPPARSTTASRR